MSRRERRSGVRFIEDDRDRSLTFFKRRSGLFKAASDLSTLTGARVAVVLESENGRFSSFGTPEASTIVDAFLSGDPPVDFYSSEEQKAKITSLQNGLFKLEKSKAIEEKRKQENMARAKKIQETSRMAKYVYGKEEDLDAVELFEMYRELTRIKQEINDLLPTPPQEKQVAIGGRLRDPSLLVPTWWHSMPSSKVATPPVYSSWAPLQDTFQQHPWSSSSYQMLARSGSVVPKPVMLPSQQVPPKPQQHPVAPRVPSMVRLPAPKMLPPKEVYHHNHNTRGLNTNIRKSRLPLSFSPVTPASPPQPSLLQTPPSNDSSPLSLSLKFRSHQPFYSNLPRPNVELGNMGGNGDQSNGGQNEGFGLSAQLHAQVDDWARVTPESFTPGESSTAGGDAGSNLGDLNFPWY